jgi:hypothetical protein
MDKIEELRKTYQKAQITLIERINANLVNEDPLFREKMLKSVDAELKALDKYAEQWAGSEIPRNYMMSVRSVYQYLGAAVPVNVVMRNQQAMSIIMQNLLDDLHDAHNFVGRQVRDNLRQASLEAISQKIAVGDTIQQTKANMIKLMTNQGITAIQDKAGRNIRLDSYAEMVARTTTREATNKACMNTMTALGEDLVRMTSVGSTCPICAPLEGRVYSITGRDSRYPRVSQALPTGGTIHPNCKHNLTPYIERFDPYADKNRVLSNRPFDVTPSEQKRVDKYREQQSARTALRNDRRQYERYKMTLGNDAPKTFSAFRRKKMSGSWNELESKYRSARTADGL